VCLSAAFTAHADERAVRKDHWHDADMDALVWVDAYQVQSYGGEPFAVGQQVAWPISMQFNERALTEHVGAATAAQVSMVVDWHALRPEDTVDHTGIVSHIEVYRCRLAQGHVVPGSVETHPVVEADGWEPEEDGVHFSGYLMTLTSIRPAVER
jgi:hypothetical protein